LGGATELSVDQYGNVGFGEPGYYFGWDNVNGPGITALSTGYGPLTLTTDGSGGSNDSIFLIPNGTGGVGIGTTTPWTTLDVAGSARFVSVQGQVSSGANGVGLWVKLGTFTTADDGGETLVLKNTGGNGYDGTANEQDNTEISLRRTWNGECDNICVSGFYWNFGGGGLPISNVKVVQTGGLNSNTFDVYVYTAQYTGDDSWTAEVSQGATFAWINTSVSDPGTGANILSVYYGIDIMSGMFWSDGTNVGVGNTIFSNGASVGIGNTSPGATLDVTGHLANSGTSASLAACGGGSPAINGNDTRGTVTLGTGAFTSCSIVFAATYATTPICVASWVGTAYASTGIVVNASTSSLSVYFPNGSAGKIFNYFCMQ
jgi:hypothetical protein